MKQIYSFEAQECLDEYLINIDREPIHVKVSGINCPDAVIICQDEFSRLKHAENSFHTIGSIVKRLVNYQLLSNKKTNYQKTKSGRKK